MYSLSLSFFLSLSLSFFSFSLSLSLSLSSFLPLFYSLLTFTVDLNTNPSLSLSLTLHISLSLSLSLSLPLQQETVKLLLWKKDDELYNLKEKLKHIDAHHVLRLELDEMFQYLNSKRDLELSSFRNSLFLSLNSRKREINVEEEWGGSIQKREEVNEEYKKRRLDEPRELIRQDEVRENPQIPKVLNILAMENIKHQTDVLNDFIHFLRRE